MSAREVAVDELRHLVATLDAAETTSPQTRWPVTTAARCPASRLCPRRRTSSRGPSPFVPTRPPAASRSRCRSPRRCSSRPSHRSARRSARRRPGRRAAPPLRVPAGELEALSRQVDADDPFGALEPAQPTTAPRPTVPAPKTTQVDPGRPWPCSSPRRSRSRGRTRTDRPDRAAPRSIFARAISGIPCTPRTSTRRPVSGSAHRRGKACRAVRRGVPRSAARGARGEVRGGCDSAAASRHCEERDDVVAGSTSETPSPIASTTPAPSCPSTVGE